MLRLASRQYSKSTKILLLQLLQPTTGQQLTRLQSPQTSWLSHYWHVRWLSEPATSQSSIKCWNCERVIPVEGEGEVKFLCPCEKRVVLPPTSHDYFKIFSCPESFNVDIAHLKDRYRALQRILHPDKFTTKPKAQQGYSAQQSTIVNRAYSTLMKPYLRGLYLLKRHGLTIDEQDNTGADLEFLAEMMEVNEEIHEMNPSPQRLKDIRAVNSGKLQQCTDVVGRSFLEGDYAGAKEGLARMKYLANIEEEIIEKLDVE